MTIRRSDVAGRGHPKQGRMRPRRRGIDRTLQNPSTWSLQRPTSFCPMPIRRCGLRLTQPARRSQIEEALLSLELSWVHRARRPVGGLLLCQSSMVRQRLTGGTAAGDNEKVPSGRPRGRALPRSALLFLIQPQLDERGKGAKGSFGSEWGRYTRGWPFWARRGV